MAWTRVQGGANYSGAAAAASISVTLSAVGSGNALCGVLGWDIAGGVTLTSVTDDKGNTYNLESVVQDTGYSEQFCAFSRTNITNAPTIITVNFSGSVDFRFLLVDEFSGGSTASSDERDATAHGGQIQLAPGTGTDAVTSGTFTTTQNGDLIWGATVDTNTDTVGTGFTTGTTENTDFSKQTEYRTQATAGAGTAATFTASLDDHHITYMIALKPAGVTNNLMGAMVM
jgi:hypothetical protein